MTPPVERVAVLKSEAGFTLTETVAVLAILSTVLTALMTLFVSGIRAEADMNRRFQAQQQTRVALAKLRREVRCASGVGTTPTSSQVTLNLGAYCPTAAGATQATWCTVSVAPQRYRLFRKPGAACDASGVKQADYLTSGAVFSYETVSGNRPRLLVSLSADLEPSNPSGTYLLQDAITLRNSPRVT